MKKVNFKIGLKHFEEAVDSYTKMRGVHEEKQVS
jgi:hypothetical protein